MTKKVYFANGLFNNAQLKYNEYLVSRLRKNILDDGTIYLPQENMAINDKDSYADSLMIFNGDNEHLDNSDLVIAILDGDTIDDGVACEIGRASALGIPILALYSDTRQQGSRNKDKLEALKLVGENQFPYLNLYVSGAIKSNGNIVTHEEDLITLTVNFLTTGDFKTAERLEPEQLTLF